MKKLLLSILSVSVLDFLYLYISGMANNFYLPVFSNVQNGISTIMSSDKIISSLLAWFLLSISVAYISYPLTIQDKLNGNKFYLLNSSLVGLSIYGIFNATNYALFENYTIAISLVDTLWGMIIMTLSTLFLDLLL